jgi:serine/threonine-protein kinase HipA
MGRADACGKRFFVTPVRLEVRLHSMLVGTITNITGDINVFSFDERFQTDRNAPTLSFKAFRESITGVYRNPARSTRTRVHPYFSNLLPEGMLRHYLAERAGVNAERDFPLLRLLGRDVSGALRITDVGGSIVSEDVREKVREPVDRDAVLRFSLAGVQLKFSAVGDPQRGLTIPIEGMGGAWIVKLPDARFARVPENEFSMLRFAREIGLEVPPIALVDPKEIAGLPSDVRNFTGKALAVKRFDRGENGARIHTEDFAQANEVYPARKYASLNFDTLAEQIALFGGLDAVLDFTRRLVFTIGIGNGDMHLKNWSVIYRDGVTPSLAPVYDYVSTIVYMPNDDLGLNFLGSKLFRDAHEKRFEALADRARVPRLSVLRAVRETVERMKDVWPRLASDLELDAEMRYQVQAHMESMPLFAKP